jgi:hypothetical protein
MILGGPNKNVKSVCYCIYRYIQTSICVQDKLIDLDKRTDTEVNICRLSRG